VILMICGVTPAYAGPQSDVQATLPLPEIDQPPLPRRTIVMPKPRFLTIPEPCSRYEQPDCARDLSPGVSRLSTSFWQPYVSVTSMFDTNALTIDHQSGLTTWTSLYGGIDLHKVSGQSDSQHELPGWWIDFE